MMSCYIFYHSGHGGLRGFRPRCVPVVWIVKLQWQFCVIFWERASRVANILAGVAVELQVEGTVCGIPLLDPLVAGGEACGLGQRWWIPSSAFCGHGWWARVLIISGKWGHLRRARFSYVEARDKNRKVYQQTHVSDDVFLWKEDWFQWCLSYFHPQNIKWPS